MSKATKNDSSMPWWFGNILKSITTSVLFARANRIGLYLGRPSPRWAPDAGVNGPPQMGRPGPQTALVPPVLHRVVHGW